MSRAATVRAWVRGRFAKLDARDYGILVALGLVWYGLHGIYRPLAPLVVGLFLLWFITIRRVPE